MKKILINIFLFYLRFLSKIQIVKINPLIIGVGGASGKSSLSELVSIVLEEKFRVKKSKGKNSETGIPLNILDVEMDDYSLLSWIKAAFTAFIKIFTNWGKYDVYVVEMGIDSPKPPKNMSYLLQIIKPKIGILTNIQIEHSLYFESDSERNGNKEKKEEIIEKIANQELLLLKSIDELGRCIINLDDPYIKSLLPLKSKIITLSAVDKSADFYISKIEISEYLFKIEFTFLKENYEINIGTPLPKYYAYSFVFAIAVAFACEINVKSAINHLENKFILPPGRFSVFKGIKNSTIFDSSYNSSLEAAGGALGVLKEIGNSRRKVGILGDIRELGSLSRDVHEALAREILKTLDFVILIGPMINEFVVPILKKEKFNFVYFDSFKSAKDFIPELVKNKDLILVKASQNTLYFERVVELLLADKKDKDKLCRRGKYWDKVRQRSS